MVLLSSVLWRICCFYHCAVLIAEVLDFLFFIYLFILSSWSFRSSVCFLMPLFFANSSLWLCGRCVVRQGDMVREAQACPRLSGRRRWIPEQVSAELCQVLQQGPLVTLPRKEPYLPGGRAGQDVFREEVAL